MHILIIPSWYPEEGDDVSGSFFREQAIAMKNHGHQIGVVYPQLRSVRNWRSLFTGMRGLQADTDEMIHTFRWHGMAWSLRAPFSSLELWVKTGLKLYECYVKQHGRPDLVHAHSLLNAGVLASEIKKRHKVPFVVTEHSTAYGKGEIASTLGRHARDAANSADARLAVSAPFAELLQQYFGASVGTWKVLPNILSAGFEKALFARPADNGEPFIFINVSMLTARKGIDILLRGFAQSFKKDGNIRLLIGGDGGQRRVLESLASELGISRQVDFLGRLSRKQVVSAIANSHAYILASHIETFGVAVIEALAMGKPAIVTRCGGPETIVRAEDGLVIPANDADALSSAMIEVKNKYDRYKGEVIRRSCISRYGESAVVGQLNKVYESVAANSSMTDDGS